MCRKTHGLPLFQNKKSQTVTTNDPSSPLFEITNYPGPPGVVFVVLEAHTNQLWSHADHTSVTNALTKPPESLETMGVTLRCETTVDYCLHYGKWFPGAELDALSTTQS